MKKRFSGLALVLAFALASLGIAQAKGGPPVPEGCVFELGVMTCVVEGTPYPIEPIRLLSGGDTYCFSDGTKWQVDSDDGVFFINSAYIRTTTEYRGVSDVVRSVRSVEVGTIVPGHSVHSTEVGTCW